MELTLLCFLVILDKGEVIELFPHKKEIEVTNQVVTFEISEVANEISLEIARSRPLKPGEYVVLPEKEEQKNLPKAIVTNSTSDFIKQDRILD